MKYDPEIHHRQSIRLAGYDYSQAGGYFITIVTHGRQPLFGQVVDGVMQLNDAGRIAQTEWNKLAKRFPGIEMDEFVVMPNHIHAIIVIAETVGARQNPPSVGAGESTSIGARQNGLSQSYDSSLASPLPNSPLPGASSLRGPGQGVLGTMIGSYKSTTTRIINGLRHTPGLPIWQRNYYEHIIRNETDSNRIRNYIETNPMNWANDSENK